MKSIPWVPGARSITDSNTNQPPPGFSSSLSCFRIFHLMSLNFPEFLNLITYSSSLAPPFWLNIFDDRSDSLMISSYLDIPPISQSPCLIISFQTCNQNEYFFQKFYGPLEMPSIWLSHLMVRDFEHFLSSVRINLL